MFFAAHLVYRPHRTIDVLIDLSARFIVRGENYALG
jgi:hypothetical protein